MSTPSTLERIAEIEGNLAQAEGLKAKGNCAAGVRAYVKDVAFLLGEIKLLMADRAKDWKLDEENIRLFGEAKIYREALERIAHVRCAWQLSQSIAREALAKGRGE